MQLPIKGKREKESISEIRSKPKPADVTAKTALMSPSVCTAVQNRRRPPACQSESCHLRPNKRSRKSGIDFGTSRPGTLRFGEQSRVAGCEYDHIRRKGESLRSRTVRMRPAQASEPQPQQQRTERLRSAIRRMYKRAGADEGIVPLSYRRRSTPALCHSQNERSRPRKRRNNVPGSSGRNARALPFAVCTNVPVPMKNRTSGMQKTEARPRSAIRRTSGRVRTSVRTTSPAAADGTPALCHSPYVQTCRR